MKSLRNIIPLSLTLIVCLSVSACSTPETPASAPPPPDTHTLLPSQPPTPTSTPVPSPIPSYTPTPASTPTTAPLIFQLEVDGSGDFPSLAAAVQNAPAGATISLGAGVYRLDQALEIDKSLSLVGQGVDQTEIVSSADEYTVHVNVKGAFSAEGITFRHEGDAFADAVEVEQGEVTFNNCRFSGGVINPDGKQRGSGLRLREAAGGIIQNCVAEENFTGIWVLAMEITLEKNLSTKNKAGIAFGADSKALARENQVLENQYNGFVVSTNSNPTLERNTSSGNGENGFLFQDGATGTALGNICSQNYGSGIMVAGMSQSVIEGNTCNQNTNHGIVIAENARAEIRNNECSENQMSGILVADSAQATIEGNTSTKNTRFGIAVGIQAQGVVRRNICSQNLRIGILVAENATAVLEDNVCNNNILAGIAFLDNASGSASRNQCISNETGIIVQATANPILADNDCHDNTQNDILDER